MSTDVSTAHLREVLSEKNSARTRAYFAEVMRATRDPEKLNSFEAEFIPELLIKEHFSSDADSRYDAVHLAGIILHQRAALGTVEIKRTLESIITETAGGRSTHIARAAFNGLGALKMHREDLFEPDEIPFSERIDGFLRPNLASNSNENSDVRVPSAIVRALLPREFVLSTDISVVLLREVLSKKDNSYTRQYLTEIRRELQREPRPNDVPADFVPELLKEENFIDNPVMRREAIFLAGFIVLKRPQTATAETKAALASIGSELVAGKPTVITDAATGVWELLRVMRHDLFQVREAPPRGKINRLPEHMKAVR